MAEFIEREKALEECDWYASEFSECEYAIMPLKGALEILPAADVLPVVRGKWEQTKDEFGIYNKCSVCGKEYYCGPIAPFNFCPNCGAEMMEES